MKNIFAVIGFAVVVKKGYKLFREYREMKYEKRSVQQLQSTQPRAGLH
ncbi:hypothetical protein ACNFH8_24790 [Pseudomonas sp. NY15436]